jgi:ABC-type lipoprotein export system ATPase subunit
VVCITHNLDLANQFGRRIAIRDGQVVNDQRRTWTV